ncbi:MAG TPA: hypothetical protein VIQ29_10835 [Ancylobacter sp.]
MDSANAPAWTECTIDGTDPTLRERAPGGSGPVTIQRFPQLMREQLAFDTTIRIIGLFDDNIRVAFGPNGQLALMVRKFVQEWCRKQDSNL